jgi:LEA14-like dessication related protein
MRHPSPGLLLILCFALVLTACAGFRPQIEQPNINLVGLDIRELGLLQQRYVLTLSVQNPNAIAIPVRGMSYALQVAGDDFAKGVSPKAFTVPAYGETEVQVEMTTNLVSTLRNIQELMSARRDVLGYELAGKLEVDLPFANTIPFRNSGEFKLSE